MDRDSFQSIHSTQDKLLHTYGYPTHPLEKWKKVDVEINLFITNLCTPNNLLTQYSIWVYKQHQFALRKSWGHVEIICVSFCLIINVFVFLYVSSWLNLLDPKMNCTNKIIEGLINYHGYEDHFQSRIILEYPILPH